MPDVRTMTLDEVLSAEPSVLNTAIEWAVFSDDGTANTDERRRRVIADIVSCYLTSGPDNRRALSVAVRLESGRWTRSGLIPVQTTERPGIWCEEWIWSHREGKPWQKEIESHVAAYRHPARDFLGDWNLTWLVVERMKELATQDAAGECDAWYFEPWSDFTETASRGYMPQARVLWNLSRRSILEAVIRVLWPRVNGGE